MVIVKPKWLDQPCARQASVGPSEASTPKTTGSGCMDCSSHMSKLQDQVVTLTRELAESNERQQGMVKEIDALKELFEGMRSMVFTAPSTGPSPSQPVANAIEDTSGDVPAPHTPPIVPTSPPRTPASILGDIPAPAVEYGVAATSTSIPLPQQPAAIDVPCHNRFLSPRSCWGFFPRSYSRFDLYYPAVVLVNARACLWQRASRLAYTD